MNALRLRFATTVAVGLLCSLSASASRHQTTRVAEDARIIRTFRLNQDHLTKLRQVSETMARNFRPAPEKPRADAAIFAVLSMSFAYNEPFRDQTVTDMVRTIESGHADLHAAIRGAVLTTPDYVLTQMTLLLAYPIVAVEKTARPLVSAADVATENVAFVKIHRGEVEAILQELAAVAGPQPAQMRMESVDRFHQRGLRPAMQAITAGNLPEARRLARIVLSEFESLSPEFQAGQVGDLQRLSRLYLSHQLVTEADLLLTRAVAAWEPVMRGPMNPLGPLYADLAKARRLSGKIGDADALLQQAQMLRGREPTPADPDAYLIFVEIAELRRQRGDADGAAQLLRTMIDYADRMQGWQYVPNLIAVFESYALTLEQAGRAAEARQFRGKASTIRKNYP